VAKHYGIKTISTEHSLFSFNDMAGINLNKICKWAFREVDAAIAVSTACKENVSLRLKIDPTSIFTIPNAVDTEKFTPKLTITN